MAVKNGSTISIVHTDYLSTPRIIMNGGSIVWQWRNDNPYGNNLAQGSIEFNLRFAGQYYDSESGLHYNINRMYNPELGRYMQSDPMGLAAGLNTYNYANRNPLDNLDPNGLEGYSGTNDPTLSEAIHNAFSVPIGALGITLHSEIDRDTGEIGVNIEAGSELYQYLKMKNPLKEAYKNNSDVLLTAQGLAEVLKENFDLSSYVSIDLKVCNLGSHNNPGEKIIFAQKVSNETRMPVTAYTSYITASKTPYEEAYFSGYYTNPVLFRSGPIGRVIGITTWQESNNGEAIKVEFNPK